MERKSDRAKERMISKNLISGEEVTQQEVIPIIKINKI
jgi:hypothetical protein